ncbi:DNA polymerase [Streptomyces sp. URMC 125]|uniref:DNA polymerase n=1 Tax=Streptomyces sp. URMC 125 TaxID=3423419 RepID=UPI003F194CA5
MRELGYTIKNSPVRINVVEGRDDLPLFQSFLERNPVLGFDTETTGLDWWSPNFRCRLVQFGNSKESFVLPVELGGPFEAAAVEALRKAKRLIAHNGVYDRHVAEVSFGIPLEELAPKTLDTKFLAHLVDPRSVKEGGPGLSLEDLTRHYIDPQVADEIKGSVARMARDLSKELEGEVYLGPGLDGEDVWIPAKRISKDTFWKAVPLDHPGYNLYAGMDPILAYRLFHILLPKVPARSKKSGLISWEHRLAHVTSKMERTGYLVDREYVEARIEELLEEQRKYEEIAFSYMVENINSNAQLIKAFTDFGVRLTKRTKSGQFAMDDSVLQSIDHPLAEAVVKAKRANKWRATWFERALNGMDAEGRVHASINSIQARTARMSITGAIPAQTFPAGDGYVRHSFLAEEGHVTASIDFGNMELRVLAAASEDPVMLDAFRRGDDLHNLTAIAAFGPMPEGAEKHPMRKAGKGTNFTVCFGGGWKAVHQQWGISPEDSKKAVQAFWDTYLGTKAFSEKLQRQARRNGYIYTATGRRLPVDEDRAYSALNYYIQSSARDITARAVIELDRAGFGDYMRLPIHDEIVFSFPREEAKELTREAARIMQFPFKGLLIPADGEIGERSWGSVLELEDSKH